MENENINTTIEETQEETKTYTQEEVDALIQSKSDQRVTQATDTMNRKIKALERQLENQKTLSQLDEEQRAVEEQRLKYAELQEELQTYKDAARKNEAIKTFSANGLPVELVDFLKFSDDPEDDAKMVASIREIFKRTRAQDRKEWLAETSAVPQIADAMSGKMTKEQFNKLSIAEQQAMYNSDPELVRNLLG